MTAVGGTQLHGFAYGEYLEGPQRRSLGYRLLTPAHTDWGASVEALAHALQAAPYPDHWPASELFCSVLLPDNRRLVALAHYGLTDQTPGRRRGGLELIGVVGPKSALGVTAARSVCEWLKLRRAATELGDFGREFDLSQLLAEAPGPSLPAAPVPVLPVRLWPGGALVFAATSPGEPDQRLGLLDDAPPDWQWLPLIGPDFPLAEYVGRGPLVAWAPHLAALALKLEAPPAAPPSPAPPARPSHWPALTLGGVAVALMVAVLALLLDVRAKLAAPAPAIPPTQPVAEGPRPQPATPPVATADSSADRLALALHQFLTEQGGLREADAKQLRQRYEELAARDARLKVSDPRGQQAIGLIPRLAGRSPEQVERAVRAALANRGYDPKLVELVAERVRHQLQDEAVGP